MKRCVSVVFSVLLLFSFAHGNDDRGQPKIHGKTLGKWMELYWTWALGGDQDGKVKDVIFLPLPVGVPSDEDPSILLGELDFTLRTGQSLALPMFVYGGETYLEDAVPDDDPAFPPKEVFTGAKLVLKLDGRTIIDSECDDLRRYYYNARYFDETIFYDEPREYAPDVHAIGAIWVKGLGIILPPMSRGNHTLELTVYSDDFGFGFQNTWNITVKKK